MTVSLFQEAVQDLLKHWPTPTVIIMDNAAFDQRKGTIALPDKTTSLPVIQQLPHKKTD